MLPGGSSPQSLSALWGRKLGLCLCEDLGFWTLCPASSLEEGQVPLQELARGVLPFWECYLTPVERALYQLS